jgi:tRNA-dihydrouridine synthase
LSEGPPLQERIAIAKRHLEMSIKWKGERLGLLETRRHYSNYFKGLTNFKPYRTRLVTGETIPEVMSVFNELEERTEILEATV